MLKKMLEQEKVDRQTEVNRKVAESAEAAAIVAGVHEIFNKELAGLKKLNLIGDYGRPIPILERNPQGMTKSNGISIALGSVVSRAVLQLLVAPRNGEKPATVKLSIVRDYPYETERLSEIDGHAPVEQMLEALFAVLIKNVAQP